MGQWHARIYSECDVELVCVFDGRHEARAESPSATVRAVQDDGRADDAPKPWIIVVRRTSTARGGLVIEKGKQCWWRRRSRQNGRRRSVSSWPRRGRHFARWGTSKVQSVIEVVNKASRNPYVEARSDRAVSAAAVRPSAARDGSQVILDLRSTTWKSSCTS
jgi:hypothetical protein